MYFVVIGAEIKPFAASYVPPLAVDGAGVDLNVGVVRPAIGWFGASYVPPSAAYGAGVDLSVGVDRGVQEVALSRDCQKSISCQYCLSQGREGGRRQRQNSVAFSELSLCKFPVQKSAPKRRPLIKTFGKTYPKRASYVPPSAAYGAGQYILRHGQVTFTTELELHGAIGAEINQCRSDMRSIMEAVRGGNGFFSSSTAYMPRMGLLHACYLVLTAYMAKYTMRTFSVQEDLVTAKIELQKHNCALAKVHLAYLCTLQQQDGTQHLMDYLHILCAEYGQKFCAWCKTKTLEENNVCSRCTLTRYCSRFCQTAANNRMHNGGNLLEPPHSRICRVLVPYKKLHKATVGRGHIRASNTEAFSALVETRMLQGMQNPAAKHAFLELQRAIQNFLQHGPFSRPSSRG